MSSLLLAPHKRSAVEVGLKSKRSTRIKRQRKTSLEVVSRIQCQVGWIGSQQEFSLMIFFLIYDELSKVVLDTSVYAGLLVLIMACYDKWDIEYYVDDDWRTSTWARHNWKGCLPYDFYRGVDLWGLLLWVPLTTHKYYTIYARQTSNARFELWFVLYVPIVSYLI